MSNLIKWSVIRLFKMKRGVLGLMVLALYFLVHSPLNILLCAALVGAWLYARHGKQPAQYCSRAVSPTFTFVERDTFDVDAWFDKKGFDEVCIIRQKCEDNGKRNCVLSKEMKLPGKAHWPRLRVILAEYGIVSDIADGEFHTAWGPIAAQTGVSQ